MSAFNETNQDILKTLVAREVAKNQTTVVNSLLESEVISWDDVDNSYNQKVKEDQYRYTINLDERGEFSATVYKIDENGNDVEELSIDTEEAEFLSSEGVNVKDATEVLDHYDIQYSVLLDSGDDVEYETDYDTPQDIYEWWLVTDFFADKLRDEDQPVLEALNCTWWGRTCSGQVIYADSVIMEIAKGMQILEGQKHSWAKRDIK
jgi:hypothetical protein